MSNRRSRVQRRWHWLGGPIAVGMLVGGGFLASVGASTAAMASTHVAAKPTQAAIEKTCQRIADVLSDGPDPGVDPVGYALAQVLPLRQITTSDTALHKDIDALANAYETVYKTNDKKGTESSVNKAGKAVDTICPGAF